MKQSATATAVDAKKEARSKALEAVFTQIDKAFGKGSVMLFGQKEHAEVKTISTGSLSVDFALGCGGIPKGRVVEVFGPEASGKTTLTLHALAQAQKEGGTCAFIDAEHAMDPAYARSLGVDIDNLIISQPDYGEQALEITEMLLRSGAVDMIVVDSVAALVPKAELEGEMGDTHVGLQARLMSQALRKITALVHKSNAILIFINQIRHKIGPSMPFANNETTTGGNALKFYSSVRMEVRRMATIKKGDVAIGNRVVVKVVKNKVAPPFARAEVELIFGHGIDPELDLLSLALRFNIVNQSGSWISFKNENIAQGKENCAQQLRENASLRQEIHKLVVHAMESARAV